MFFAAVSDNYFSALGVAPAAGRLFTTHAGSPVHVVLGYSFWMTHFHGDPGAVGRFVRVDGHPAVVTGVVQQSFRGTYLGIELEGYVPIDDLGALDPDVNAWLYHNRKARPVELFGRLKPGVSVAAADTEVKALLATLAVEHPEDAGVSGRVVPEPLARPLPMRVVSDVPAPARLVVRRCGSGARGAARLPQRGESDAGPRDGP